MIERHYRGIIKGLVEQKVGRLDTLVTASMATLRGDREVETTI